MTRKNAGDRIKAARIAQAQTNQRIVELEAQRRDALLADDDETADALDLDLEAARRLAQRHVDKITLLGPVLVREEQERQYPSTLAGARARIAELTQRREFLTQRNKREPSAAADNELQNIAGQLEIIGNNAKHLERMQR